MVRRRPSRKSVVARKPNAASARLVSTQRRGWPLADGGRSADGWRSADGQRSAVGGQLAVGGQYWVAIGIQLELGGPRTVANVEGGPVANQW